MDRRYYVYIMASRRNGTLYVGVTNDLSRRSFEHRQKTANSFTKRYNISLLVYAEEFNSIEQAIAREKAIKKWNRAWKLELIETSNPYWQDLMQG